MSLPEVCTNNNNSTSFLYINDNKPEASVDYFTKVCDQNKAFSSKIHTKYVDYTVFEHLTSQSCNSLLPVR